MNMQDMNEKQNEFLMKLKEIGMNILFKENMDRYQIKEILKPYEQYIDDDDIKKEFLESVKKVAVLIEDHGIKPDDLLIQLMPYVPAMHYERPITPEFHFVDDDSWFYD